MDPRTLKSIMNRGPLSENLLFRLRNSLEYALQHPGISVMRDDKEATAVQEVPLPSVIVEGEGVMAPHSVGATSSQKVSLQTSISRAAIPIVPTHYPGEPSGTIIVQNYITINTHSDDFRQFSDKVNELILELRRSNEIAGEVRDKLIAEITAGMAILNSPKPDPKLIELFLIRPLKYIGDKAAGAIVGGLAVGALGILGKLTGLF
jgi:hypothetical protein